MKGPLKSIVNMNNLLIKRQLFLYNLGVIYNKTIIIYLNFAGLILKRMRFQCRKHEDVIMMENNKDVECSNSLI